MMFTFLIVFMHDTSTEETCKLIHDVEALKWNAMQVPYLVDHNTGMEIGEYKEIVSYLFRTYSSKSIAAYLQQ